IGDSAFSGCSNLTSISVASNNPKYSSDNGVLFNKDKSTLLSYPAGKSGTSYIIPNSVTAIGYRAFFSCSNLTSISIPDSVTTIGDSAFWGCENLTNISIPDGVTTIGYRAFYKCDSLTSISIPDSVTTIGDSAFEYCDSLTNISIPDSVTTIGDYAFSSCGSLTSINIPDNVTSIGDWTFAYCDSLTSINIPDSVTSIGDFAFEYCESLTSINIPNGVTTIGRWAFGVCSGLTSISIPNSVTNIGTGAFWRCENLTSINIPNSVTTIGDYAFENCYSLTNISIPDGVTTIGRGAFEYCDSLTSIDIPDSVTNIGDVAFYDCDCLTDVYYSGTEAQWYEINIGIYNECLRNANINYKYTHYNPPHVCPFSDIKDSAHHTNIETAFERGYVNGYGDGKYAPSKTVTRAQFITMLWRAAGKPAPANKDITFKDIAADDYCRDAIAWGSEKGIVNGYDEKTFGRNDPVTRAQAMTFIARYCEKIVGMSLDDSDYGFLDINEASAKFIPSINAMANAGIVLGYGTTCGPNDKATRGQIASILVRAMDTIG
ncbi:MAG: leucine-rich repeat protein, partial [Bacillota bacterium]|nr:leucine-rich repeat protein [Bacillota bacterium]